jgi:hypothetical protein
MEAQGSLPHSQSPPLVPILNQMNLFNAPNVYRLGGVVVTVLITGPKGREFKPGCKILRLVKNPLRYFRYW